MACQHHQLDNPHQLSQSHLQLQWPAQEGQPGIPIVQFMQPATPGQHVINAAAVMSGVRRMSGVRQYGGQHCKCSKCKYLYRACCQTLELVPVYQ